MRSAKSSGIALPRRASAAAAPEECLRRALAARTPASRARHAKLGLATPAAIDRTTQAMLLRQLYVSLFDSSRFSEALDIAEQAVQLGVLSDVLHQDAARAALAAGRLEPSLEHLRTAARVGPASRRAFHLWSLGGTLFLAARYSEAAAILHRAIRWATHDRSLYRAHFALARIAMGDRVDNLQEIVDSLRESATGRGYGQFLLGHIAYAANEWATARKYLEAFLLHIEPGPFARRVSLAGELKMTRATLAKISNN